MAPLTFAIEPRETALVVIDMQNGFASSDAAHRAAPWPTADRPLAPLLAFAEPHDPGRPALRRRHSAPRR